MKALTIRNCWIIALLTLAAAAQPASDALAASPCPASPRPAPKTSACTASSAFSLPATSLAPAVNKDTINYSSTCVNSTISFGTPLFDSLPFPSYISWNFGDPASGIFNGAGTQQPRHVYSTPGLYNIVLKVLNNSTDTIYISGTINIVSPLTYNFGPDIYLCEAKDTFLVAPVIPGAVYTWNDDSLTHSDTLHVSKSGVYTVSINGCGVSDSIGVFVSATPKIDLGKDHILCSGEILELNAASQNAQYTWMLNGTVLPSDQAQLPVIDPGGTYICIVTVPGCGVYKDTVNITFSMPVAPAFSLGPDTLLCPKQIYTLTASAAGATAYDWSTGATGSSISITDPGVYWAFVTIGGQCQVVDTVNVTYRGDKKLDFHDTAICKGSTLSLDADFGVGTYNWQSVPPQRDDQNQTGQSTYYVYKAGTYSITATVGQCVYTDTLTVTFDDSLEAKMNGDTTLCNGEDFWLQVKGNADTLTWQDGTMGASYQVTKSGMYSVIAANGCGRDTLKAVIDFVTCGCNLLLPNAFTPDGNGINDNFRPLHACQMSDYHIAIFDRNGNMVFQSADPGAGWDGTFHGVKVPAGNFVWMVRYFSTDTKLPVFRKGQVLVIR